jgi:hypothetical protein
MSPTKHSVSRAFRHHNNPLSIQPNQQLLLPTKMSRLPHELPKRAASARTRRTICIRRIIHMRNGGLQDRLATTANNAASGDRSVAMQDGQVPVYSKHDHEAVNRTRYDAVRDSWVPAHANGETSLRDGHVPVNPNRDIKTVSNTRWMYDAVRDSWVPVHHNRDLKDVNNACWRFDATRDSWVPANRDLEATNNTRPNAPQPNPDLDAIQAMNASLGTMIHDLRSMHHNLVAMNSELVDLQSALWEADVVVQELLECVQALSNGRTETMTLLVRFVEGLGRLWR